MKGTDGDSSLAPSAPVEASTNRRNLRLCREDIRRKGCSCTVTDGGDAYWGSLGCTQMVFGERKEEEEERDRNRNEFHPLASDASP